MQFIRRLVSFPAARKHGQHCVSGQSGGEVDINVILETAKKCHVFIIKNITLQLTCHFTLLFTSIIEIREVH